MLMDLLCFVAIRSKCDFGYFWFTYSVSFGLLTMRPTFIFEAHYIFLFGRFCFSAIGCCWLMLCLSAQIKETGLKGEFVNSVVPLSLFVLSILYR